MRIMPRQRRATAMTTVRSAALAIPLAGAVGWGMWSPDAGETITEARPASHLGWTAPHDVALASPGRVEGASEAIELGAGLDGVIAELRVREGDRVQKGDTLAVIDRRELAAELRGARAAADAMRQARARLLRGSRAEERARADADVAAAEAAMTEAESRQARSVRLFDAGAVAAASRDAAQRDLDVARAQVEAARQRAELVKAPPLPEEVGRADADVRAAEERVRSLERTIEKAFIRAPIGGTVLQTLLEPGESFSTLVPRPILVLADTSELRVRAEVDERDVSRVFPGQQVLVRADGWDGAGVTGRVTRLGAQMGRKVARTGDPAEKSDRDVLEVLVDLQQPDPRMVVGLRVTAVFLK
jgi:multidrug resistance efflux pump